MNIAVAHTLGSDHSLAERMSHQLLGSHHLPLTILLIVVGVVALWTFYRKVAERNRR
jgi:spore maturation protein SpmA